MSERGQTQIRGQDEKALPQAAQERRASRRRIEARAQPSRRAFGNGLSAAQPPNRRELLKRVLEGICSDIADAKRVVEYAGDRVFHDKKLPSTEKVLSLSDGSAAYIKKGARDPVIGYKPQLVRSKNGFVTSLMAPQGNAVDSIKLVSAIRESIERTGVVAELVNTDDGYASAKGRDELLDMGVKILSISGAKGNKRPESSQLLTLRSRDYQGITAPKNHKTCPRPC